MGRCKVIKDGPTKVCVGSLRTPITIYSRAIIEPEMESTDFDLNFSNAVKVYGLVKTTPNRTTFDSTNTERTVSHTIYIRYRSNFTPENWLKIRNDYYDVISYSNMEEENIWMELLCNIRGITTKPVNFA